MKGDDFIAELEVDNFSKCQALCQNTINCFFFSYGHKNEYKINCILHERHAYGESDLEVTSGFFTYRFTIVPNLLSGVDSDERYTNAKFRCYYRISESKLFSQQLNF